MERRTFNQLATVAFAELLFGGSLSGCVTRVVSEKPVAASKGQVLVCLNPVKVGASHLRIFDWDSYRFTDVEVPIGLIHSVIQDRTDKNIVYLFEAFGSCVKMNLRTKQVVKLDHHAKHMFNGHGALSGSGEFIACTEIDPARGSFVTLRSTKDLSLVEDLPDECNRCHQVISVPNSNLMVTGNMMSPDGKQTGGFTFYDYESRKVVNRVELPFPVLHLMAISPTEVIGASLFNKNWSLSQSSSLMRDRGSPGNLASFTSTREILPGPIYYAAVDGTTKTLWDESKKELFHDNFGLAKIAKGRFFSGHQRSGKVILWDDYKMTKIISVPKPKNIQISGDGTEFMVMSDEKIVIFSMSTFEPLHTFAGWPAVAALSNYS